MPKQKNGYPHGTDDEEGGGDGGQVFMEYEWAGQTRIRATSLLEGGYAGIETLYLGFVSCGIIILVIIFHIIVLTIIVVVVIVNINYKHFLETKMKVFQNEVKLLLDFSY